MVERQSRRPVGLELGGNFRLDLPPQRGTEGNLRAVAGEVVAEASVAVEQLGNLRAVRDRIAIDEDEVQPDAERRQGPRARHRIGRRRSADHEARRTQDTAPVRRLDGGVYRLAEPEIVCCDDQPVQCASSHHSRRKEKNSTPSRCRRAIICGPRAISDMMAAILGARK